MTKFYNKYWAGIWIFVMLVCQTVNLIWCIINPNIHYLATWFAAFTDGFILYTFIFTIIKYINYD